MHLSQKIRKERDASYLDKGGFERTLGGSLTRSDHKISSYLFGTVRGTVGVKVVGGKVVRAGHQLERGAERRHPNVPRRGGWGREKKRLGNGSS